MISLLKKASLWYWLITKRLLKKISFLVILALIPISTLLMMTVKEDEKGLLRVALSSESQDQLSKEMLDAFNSESKIVGYTLFDTPQTAIDAVKSGNADVAWVLEDNLQEKIKQNADGEKTPLVNVYASEDNMLVKASRELMFTKVYSRVAYEVFKNYVDKLDLPPERATEDILEEAFFVVGANETLVEFEFKGSVQIDMNESSYLTSPIRGLLATLVLLCSMAATLYFLNDEKNGTFSSFSVYKRCLLFFAGNMAAALLSSVFALLALAISGVFYNVVIELVSSIIFSIMCSGFCMIIGSLTRSPSRFSIFIPIIFVFTIVFTPVIFSLDLLPQLQAFLPTYLYLTISKNIIYLLYMTIYSVIVIFLGSSLYCWTSKRKN